MGSEMCIRDRFGRGRSAAAVARHLDQSSAVHRHAWRSRCTHAQVTTSPHTRKPPASSGRRAASRALMNSRDLASLWPRSSLTTPQHPAGEDKAPAPRGRDGTSAQALLASTGNIWPTRNTQREANYAQLARRRRTARTWTRMPLPGRPSRHTKAPSAACGSQAEHAAGRRQCDFPERRRTPGSGRAPPGIAELSYTHSGAGVRAAPEER